MIIKGRDWVSTIATMEWGKVTETAATHPGGGFSVEKKKYRKNELTFTQINKSNMRKVKQNKNRNRRAKRKYKQNKGKNKKQGQISLERSAI